MSTRSALEFASWLRVEHPKLFRQAADRADIAVQVRNERAANKGKGLQGLGVHPGDVNITPTVEEKPTGWFNTFTQIAAGLGTTYLSLKNQRDQLQMNIDRAKIGLPPIDIGGTPIITTEVQIDSATVDKITKSAGMQVDKLLLFGALGAAAFFLLR